MTLQLKPLNSDTPSEEALDLPAVGKHWRIGRAESCRVQIDDPTVSSNHAVLRMGEDGQATLIDSDSLHGTFVNGEKITEKVLTEGDRIRMGQAEFVVNAEGLPVEKRDYDAELSVLESEVEALNQRLRDQASEAENKEAEWNQRLSEQGDEAEVLEADLNRRLLEQIKDTETREADLQGQLSEMRASLTERDASAAALQYEVTSRDGTIANLEKSNAEWTDAYNQLQAVYDENLKALAEKEEEVSESKKAQLAAEERASSNLGDLKEIGNRMLADWEPWLKRGDEDIDISPEREPEALLEEVSDAAGLVRAELNLIEPIWEEFGEGVQSELRRQCDELQSRVESLQQEIKDEKAEIAALRVDLEEVRDLVSDEIRRAQGLSRKGNDIEIPERFEKMVVAKDHETEIFNSLIVFLEEFERQLAKYQKSKGQANRRIAATMNDFRDRLVAIMEANDVKAFTIDEGTHLTPKHRKTVRIVHPEGWGGKKFTEIRFQPGEVIQVVRSGYEFGSGTFNTVLRKVDVVIRSESEE